MTEVEKYLFDQMVGRVNSLAKFVTAVGKKEFRKRSEIIAAVDTLKADIKEFTDLLKRKSSSPSSAGSAKAMAPLKKPLQESVKVLDSIKVGVKNGELNYTKFRALVKDHLKPSKEKLVQIAETYVPSGVSEEQLKAELEYLTQVDGHRDAQRILRGAGKDRKASEEQEAERNTTEAKKQMRGYLKYKSKLPTSLRGKLFQIVELPVVPYADPRLMTPNFLRKTGMEYSYIDESFAVLEKQFLLAFDLSHAVIDVATGKPAVKKTKKSYETTGLQARKRSAKTHVLNESFVIDIVERINEMSTEDYVLASSHFEFAHGSSNIAYAWLMPRKIHRMFERNGNLSKFAWGFPWSREAGAIL